jgi:TetR/AcrR family transcriptional repressor of nem operon
MRYPQNRKAETRQKLIEKAGALAKKEGFATTGVDGLMASVGLTGGAFYSHFDSKSELLVEIINRELNTSNNLIAGQGLDADIAQALSAYLSPLHVRFPEFGCVLPSLTNEVARSDDSVKEAFENGLKNIHASIAKHTGSESSAWAILALSVGTISLARGLKTPELQQEFLAASTKFALDAVKQLSLNLD